MTLILYKIIVAILIFLVSIIIAFLPLKRISFLEHTESIDLGEALASGIFLGTAFFHMLPDAIQTFNHLYPNYFFPLPEIICVSGFLFLLLLERLSLNYGLFPFQTTIPYMLLIILVVHAVTEGAALGVGITFSETVMLSIAILAHKASESFALRIMLLKHDLPVKRIFHILVFFAWMTPVGIALGTLLEELTFIGHGELIAAIFNAFAAGTFLYISTLHHLHFHKQHEETGTRGLLPFASLVFGVAIMGGIAWWS